MSIFLENYSNIHLFATDEDGNGLYKNQLGAIGSVLSHFSIRKEPALIAMPTGTGKTAVMVVLSYLLKGRKVLVLTPSVLVREQIAEQFRSPALLISSGVLANVNDMPNVYEMTGIVNGTQEWSSIITNNDVVVGIPGTIDQTPGLAEILGQNIFDLVFVDEAHHSRAKTWTNVLSEFSNAKQVLLTATPFRGDNKKIKARLVYHYPLKLAYDDGLFSEIRFIAVDTEGAQDQDGKNLLIALQAQEVFDNRPHPAHRIIIRTDTKAAADKLHKIYTENTTLRLVVVHSNLSERTIRSRINQLRNGELDGVICVDMMGEGFDFPLLKIAIVHIPHKSLAITLQFIGRISRTNTAEGNQATVIASEHEFKLDAVQLYKKESKDWSLILPDLHLARIQRQEDEQDFFESFEEADDVEDEEPTITPDLAIENEEIMPFFHVKLYRIGTSRQSTDSLSLEERAGLIDINTAVDFTCPGILSNPDIRHHHVSEEQSTAIFIVTEKRKPIWYLAPDVLNDTSHHLFVVYYDVSSGILFICATIKENELYDIIVDQYLRNDGYPDLVLLPHLKRLMADWQEPKMYNIGMKNRKTKGNSESYKQILGSMAQKGVIPADALTYTRGHSFGGAFDRVLQKNVSLGISTSSKVWSLDEKRIIYLIEWCRDLARKITDPSMDALPVPLADLDAGVVIDHLPQDIPPFFADWHEEWYSKIAAVAFMNNDGELMEEAALCTCLVQIAASDEEHITFVITKGSAEARLELRLTPRATFTYADDSPCQIFTTVAGQPIDAEKILTGLNNSPIQVYYEDLSFLSGQVYFKSKQDVQAMPDDRIIRQAWPATVNVNVEYYNADQLAAGQANLSIHDYIIEDCIEKFDIVFYDHASLEIADVVAMSAGMVKFYHCKAQVGVQPRCQVDDIYEVNGQAAKSVHWANRKLLLKQLIERADKNNIAAKLRKGTLADIKTLLESFDNPIIPVEIVIVHPGLKGQNFAGNQEAAFDRIKSLFSTTDTFLRSVSSCSLTVMCS